LEGKVLREVPTQGEEEVSFPRNVSDFFLAKKVNHWRARSMKEGRDRFTREESYQGVGARYF